jgi:hypothetical protein
LTKKASPTPNDRSQSPSPELDQHEASFLSTSETHISQESQEISQSEARNLPKTDTPTALPTRGNADDFDHLATQQTQAPDDDDTSGDDDFDDFEEGVANQAEGDEDDDFGDFDDGFQQAEETPVAAPPPPPPQPVLQHLAHLVSSSARIHICRKHRLMFWIPCSPISTFPT